MASPLYAVRVLEKNVRRAKLAVDVVHPDSNYLWEDVGFALRLLVQGAPPTSALAREIDHDEVGDSVWLRRYALGFVERVAMEIHSGKPGYGDDDDGDDDESTADDEALFLKSTFTVDVTDAAWLAHLAPGQRWESYSSGGGSAYEPHAPVRPGDVERSGPAEDAFAILPRELWTKEPRQAAMPPLVRVPAYGAHTYRAVDERSGKLAAGDLQALHGEPVLVRERRMTTAGCLVLDGNEIWLVGVYHFFSPTTRRLDERFEGTIARAEPRPGARLGERLTYDRMLYELKPTLAAASHDGREATFTLRLAPGSRLPERIEAATAFRLLITPLARPGTSAQHEELEDAPLTRAVLREAKRLLPWYEPARLPASSLGRELGNGFVASVAVEAPELRSLDGASVDEVRRAFGAPWPELHIRVVPHDPAFLSHLGRPLAPITISVDLAHVSAKPWVGPPTRADA